MNFKILQPRHAVPAAIGAALLLATVFSAAAQVTNGTAFTSFQIIGQRNIFDPNRMPHRSSHPAQQVADAFSFVGTISYAKGTFAFFDGTSPDFRKVLGLDGSIADFKVAAITSKSVSLLSGTNEIVLQMGMQMRRGDDGQWAVSTESASYAGTGNYSGGDGSGLNNFPATSAADDSQSDTSTLNTSNPPGGGENDALTRLMQRRAQEEQQLGQ